MIINIVVKMNDCYNKNEKRVVGVNVNKILKHRLKLEGNKSVTNCNQLNLKRLRKESLRDNMCDIELIIDDLNELATREIAKKKNSKGLNKNIKVARRDEKNAGNAGKI